MSTQISKGNLGSIPYGRQCITQEDTDKVLEVLTSDFLTTGPRISEFENDFSAFSEAEDCVAVANGTAALHLACIALGVQPGDKVITTALSFAASANCVEYCGGEVLFADIDPETLCISVESVFKLLQADSTRSIKGIIAVDFAGHPADLISLRKLADEHGCWILEDACHAPGSAIRNEDGHWVKTGSGVYSDLTVFSFHPVKHIAMGEGGAVTSRNQELIKKVRSFANHGMSKTDRPDEPWLQEMTELGFNYRLTDVQAALGISQLSRMSSNLFRRQEIALRYDQAFGEQDVKCHPAVPGYKHAYHLYVVQVNDRLGLYRHLRDKNIFSQVHYLPIYRHPYYRSKMPDLHLEETEKYYSRCLSLPIFHSMEDLEQKRVIQAVQNFLSKSQ